MAKLPKGTFIDACKIVLYQDRDSCDTETDKDDYQEMIIEFHDAGGGFYPVITTKRWAYDEGDYKNLFGYIEDICNKLNEGVE
jgi:hypothetical protein